MGETVLVCNPAHWLARDVAEKYFEPRVRGTIIAPKEYMSSIVSLANECREGEGISRNFLIYWLFLTLDFLFVLTENVVKQT